MVLVFKFQACTKLHAQVNIVHDSTNSKCQGQGGLKLPWVHWARVQTGAHLWVHHHSQAWVLQQQLQSQVALIPARSQQQQAAAGQRSLLQAPQDLADNASEEATPEAVVSADTCQYVVWCACNWQLAGQVEIMKRHSGNTQGLDSTH